MNGIQSVCSPHFSGMLDRFKSNKTKKTEWTELMAAWQSGVDVDTFKLEHSEVLKGRDIDSDKLEAYLEKMIKNQSKNWAHRLMLAAYGAGATGVLTALAMVFPPSLPFIPALIGGFAGGSVATIMVGAVAKTQEMGFQGSQLKQQNINAFVGDLVDKGLLEERDLETLYKTFSSNEY